MRGYLAQHSSYGRETNSNRSEQDRIKIKSQKSNQKIKNTDLKGIPETHMHSKVNPSDPSNLSRSKSTKRHPRTNNITVKLCKKQQHTRTQSNSQFAMKEEEQVKGENNFNKTYSKNRLKTQGSNCNAQTKRIMNKNAKPIQIQSNFVTNIVKDRLNNEKKPIRNDECESVKRIINLAQMTKQNRYKNPEQGQQIQISRDRYKNIQNSFEYLYQQLHKQKLSLRQAALCQVIRVVIKKMKYLEGNQENGRLIRVVRQLQQRNVRLMNLVNFMKKNGIDVDQYWTKSISLDQ